MVTKDSRARFNILDLTIIILIIALVAGIIFRGTITELLYPDSDLTINYTFEVKNIDSARLSFLTEGTALSHKENGKSMGNIVSSVSNNAYAYENSPNGTVNKIMLPDMYDAKVNVAAKGIKSDTGVFINGELLVTPGMTYTIKTTTAVYEVVILSVDWSK